MKISVYCNFLSSSTLGKYQYVPLLFLEIFMMSSLCPSPPAPTILLSMYSKFFGDSAYPMKNKPCSPARVPNGIDWRTIWKGFLDSNVFPETAKRFYYVLVIKHSVKPQREKILSASKLSLNGEKYKLLCCKCDKIHQYLNLEIVLPLKLFSKIS